MRAIGVSRFPHQIYGGYDFKIRKHDIEEFNGVLARHGAWDRYLERLVDMITELEPTLFEGTN